MQGYFVQFVAYTMAMVGFLSICLITYKKLCQQPLSKNSTDCLCIENALRINPRKQIYVVRAGKERFLVASDAETTTMLAKLENEEDNVKEEIKAKQTTTTKNTKGIYQISGMEKEEYPVLKRINEKMKA